MIAVLLLLRIVTVHQFSIEAPGAKDVKFAGDIVGWDRPRSMKKEGSKWVYEADLPEDARTEYQFVIDGKWTLDPNAESIDNGVGGRNSIYEGPMYAKTPDAVPKSPMSMEKFDVGGKNAPKRSVRLYLPSGKAKSPAIFLYGDGEDYAARLKAQDRVAALSESGKIPPVALILVPPVDRTKEYWKDSAGYEKFLVDELLPGVRKRHPELVKSPVYVGGASLGGTISMRLLQHFPKVFSGVHSQSGAFWVESKPFEPDELAKLGKKRIYLDWGVYEGDLTRSNELLAAALGHSKIEFDVKVTHEGHNWTAWKKRFDDGLVFLVGKRK